MNGLTNMLAGFKVDESANNIIDMMTDAAIARDVRDTHLAAIASAKESMVASHDEPDFSDVDEQLDPIMLDPVGESYDEDDDVFDEGEFDDFDVDSLPEANEDEMAAACKDMRECGTAGCESALMYELDALLR